jgi:hypothetical protein
MEEGAPFSTFQVCKMEKGAPETIFQVCKMENGIPETIFQVCKMENGTPETILQVCKAKKGTPESIFQTCKRFFEISYHCCPVNFLSLRFLTLPVCRPGRFEMTMNDLNFKWGAGLRRSRKPAPHLLQTLESLSF